MFLAEEAIQEISTEARGRIVIGQIETGTPKLSQIFDLLHLYTGRQGL